MLFKTISKILYVSRECLYGKCWEEEGHWFVRLVRINLTSSFHSDTCITLKDILICGKGVIEIFRLLFEDTPFEVSLNL